MEIRQVAIGSAALLGLLLWGFSLELLELFAAVLAGTAARLALKNIPFFELVTVLTVYIGSTMGGIAGAYVGFFCIILSDLVWYDFSNTVWNAPTFAAIGALSGVIHLEFVLLVGLMTLFYNIVVNTIVMAVYGTSPLASILWTAAHVFVNMAVAGYVEPRLAAIFG